MHTKQMFGVHLAQISASWWLIEASSLNQTWIVGQCVSTYGLGFTI